MLRDRMKESGKEILKMLEEIFLFGETTSELVGPKCEDEGGLKFGDLVVFFQLLSRSICSKRNM